jgi:uncharacterized protein (UPF0335 family)
MSNSQIDEKKLKNIICRIEELNNEQKSITDSIKDIKLEAKSLGFDVKIINAIIKMRKMNSEDRDEQEYLLELYKKALDM